MSAGSLGWSALLGSVLGLGLWMLIAATPRLSRPRLADRLAPQLVDISQEARRILARRSSDPSGVLGIFWRPALLAARAGLDSLLGGRSRLVQQLRRSGSATTVERYRTQQLIALASGGALGGLLAVAAASAGVALGPSLVLPATGAVAGVVVRDRLLARAVRRRSSRITQELPTMLEFLSLSLAAGEGIHDSLRRVARVGTGEIAVELRGVVAAVAAGTPLASALLRLSGELGVPALTRAVDQLVAALDRGAPLAEVLRAQAGDCREEAKRVLLELAGKKEVAMLVPLVFFILPFTIAIAVFPGLMVLQTGF
ncbi:type II secretion system F family protein [Herbiconiux sp. L3-i23]|uniref:type II secretion system F family protein n=1 Tax=Herbiconiux sp. L3-i23 TaxID=2905871 RepID=UPI0020705868|nr:type II secretion system F family protein [Herbiconiux sp. L3-i23]BDI23360.1 pilus assembly protein TadB [Herbiconiux sp. L3-i23]